MYIYIYTCVHTYVYRLEELRKSCGGAGYLQASGIAPLEADYKWRATAEGDTTVMLLQTARYLIKAAEAAAQVIHLYAYTYTQLN